MEISSVNPEIFDEIHRTATQFRLGCSQPKLYWTILTQILHDIAALVSLFNNPYIRRYPIAFLNARGTKVWSLPFFCTKLVAMARSLQISEKDVQINHRHVKRFHMVKKLRKSVKYTWRYSTKYAEPRLEHATQFRLQCYAPNLLHRS